MKDTCDRCVHCTHEVEDSFDKYFFCEIDNEYVGSRFALSEEIGCDAFVQKLDDNETEKSRS